jgi:hypothetical protein
MAAVMIGADPHKASHTAVAIGAAEEPLGELQVRACAAQAERLLAWAAAWPERTWAVEGAGGLGHLLARQLLAAGERVLDVPPKLGARVRLLAAGDVNKNDPNDARSVAVAALRSAGVREVRADDHAAVLKIWSKRYRDLGRTRTQVVCRLHAVLCDLVPGGVSRPGARAGGNCSSVTRSSRYRSTGCRPRRSNSTRQPIGNGILRCWWPNSTPVITGNRPLTQRRTSSSVLASGASSACQSAGAPMTRAAMSSKTPARRR